MFTTSNNESISIVGKIERTVVLEVTKGLTGIPTQGVRSCLFHYKTHTFSLTFPHPSKSPRGKNTKRGDLFYKFYVDVWNSAPLRVEKNLTVGTKYVSLDTSQHSKQRSRTERTVLWRRVMFDPIKVNPGVIGVVRHELYLEDEVFRPYLCPSFRNLRTGMNGPRIGDVVHAYLEITMTTGLTSFLHD